MYVTAEVFFFQVEEALNLAFSVGEFFVEPQ